ncbi:class I SAM-dependent methyltransferase [Brachybacterium hainanense]|uniref:Class I SAM-dependent methyltransferase n=1 Tax=Brachybacterium hainanense TaxID=1541174 RepID=A0ABV6R7W8_9MICO
MSTDPDRPAPTLHQSDRVILDHARCVSGMGCPCDLIVLEDESGDLTAAALEATAEHRSARVHTWSASRSRILALTERFPREITDGRLLIPAADADPEEARLTAHLAGAGTRPTGEPGAGGRASTAHLALLRLPKALRELDARARELAAHVAATDEGTALEIVAGGRVKHMTRSQNEVLAAIFEEVAATRGVGKSRALVADGPRVPVAAQEPARGLARVRVRGSDRELALRGVGGVFGGAGADPGSLLLLRALDEARLPAEEVRRAIDLGCGNGLMTAWLAAAFPQAQVLGTDDHLDAVASTRASLGAGELEREGVDVVWDTSLSREETGGADLILLNPPFHDGTAIDATLVQDLLDAAARVLRRGGQLWMVHNSHLRYRPEVENRVGRVQQMARDRRFTILRATRA